jgi:hypothetical protein
VPPVHDDENVTGWPSSIVGELGEIAGTPRGGLTVTWSRPDAATTPVLVEAETQ